MPPPPMACLNPPLEARVGARCHLKDTTDTSLSPERKHLAKCEESLREKLLVRHKITPEFALECVVWIVNRAHHQAEPVPLESKSCDSLTKICTIEAKTLQH